MHFTLESAINIVSSRDTLLKGNSNFSAVYFSVLSRNFMEASVHYQLGREVNSFNNFENRANLRQRNHVVEASQHPFTGSVVPEHH